MAEDEWSYLGSLGEEKLALAAAQVNPRVGNPEWDFPYMSECVKVWAAGPEKQCERITDGWKEVVICPCADVVWPGQLSCLDERLGVTNISAILTRDSTDTGACAKALMCRWATKTER